MVEDSKKIIDWSLKYSEELSLQVEYYTGLKSFIPDLFDIGILIKVNEKTYYGRGSDTNEETAYCKALSEAIERSILSIYNLKNTNGLAIHPNFRIAAKNAKDELIERDAFFCHYLLDKGFHQIKITSKKINEAVSLVNCKVTFYELCQSDGSIGILCSINGKEYVKPFGNILGTAYGQGIEEVAEKALIEALRMFIFFCSSSTKLPMSEQEFLSVQDVDFSHHGKLALDLNYSKEFEIFLNNCKISMNSNFPDEIFQTTVLDQSLFPIPEIPLFFVNVKSELLQNIYTGPTIEKEINWFRLSQVNGKSMSISTINLRPHPFD